MSVFRVVCAVFRPNLQPWPSQYRGHPLSSQTNFTKRYTTVYLYVSVYLHWCLLDKASWFSCAAFWILSRMFWLLHFFHSFCNDEMPLTTTAIATTLSHTQEKTVRCHFTLTDDHIVVTWRLDIINFCVVCKITVDTPYSSHHMVLDQKNKFYN